MSPELASSKNPILDTRTSGYHLEATTQYFSVLECHQTGDEGQDHGHWDQWDSRDRYGGLAIRPVLTDAYGYSAYHQMACSRLAANQNDQKLGRTDICPFKHGGFAHIPLFLDCTYYFLGLYKGRREISWKSPHHPAS